MSIADSCPETAELATRLGAKRPLPWSWILLPGIAALVLCAYAWTGTALLSGDCFAYAEVAQQLLQGDLMYVDIWQDKPPVAILFYLVPQWFAAGSAVAIQAWLAVWLLLQVGVVALLTRQGANRLQLSVTAALLLMIPLSSHEFAWASTENISNLFVVFLLFASYRIVMTGHASAWALVGLGISLVLAFNARQNTVVYGAVAGAALLLVHQHWRQTFVRMGLVASGIVGGWLVVLAVVMATSDLPAYIDTVFLYPRRYAASAPAGVGLFNIVWLIVQLVLQPLGLILLALLGLNLFERGADNWKIRSFLLLAALVGVAQCVLPMKPYGHYWANVVPLMALLAFAYLDSAQGEPRRMRSRICLAFCAVFGLLAVSTCISVAASRSLVRLDKIVAELDGISGRDDSLYVMSAWDKSAYLCFASRAQPAHRFFWCMQLDPYWCQALPQPVDEVLAEYTADPPTVIVAELQMLEHAEPEHSHKVELVKRLTERYAYETVSTVSGHRILKRKGA